MARVAMLHRSGPVLTGMVVGGLLLSSATIASELETPVPSSSRITIHDAVETLRDYCRTEDGMLWLVLPGGARFELVTSTTDPAIANPGDGAFHPFDPAEVRAALAQVRYPLDYLGAEVFLLPYPRRKGLDSAAGSGLILLSPGVRPLTREHQHAEFVHELGHIVQYALMPDAEDRLWLAYRRLRGIEDATIYSSTSIHADRPHEIFAEDFRALFGDALANYSGTIENPRLDYPARVAGLAGFMSGLVDAPPRIEALAASPNPSPGSIRFSRRSGPAVPLDVFDLSGRLLASVVPQAAAGGVFWAWDGQDRLGRPVRGQTYFARPRDGRSAALRVTLLR